MDLAPIVVEWGPPGIIIVVLVRVYLMERADRKAAQEQTFAVLKDATEAQVRMNSEANKALDTVTRALDSITQEIRGRNNG